MEAARTLFRSELDRFPTSLTPEVVDGERLSAALVDSLESAVTHLGERSASPAVLGRTQRLLRGLDQNAGFEDWETIAASIGTLDLFLCRVAPGAVDQRRAARYLAERLIGFASKNAARSLAARALLDTSATEPTLASVVLESMKERIKSVVGHDNVAVDLELRFSQALELPDASARTRLRNETLQEWRRLRRELESGRPGLIELVREESPERSHGPEIFVVHGFDATQESEPLLFAWTARSGGKELVLRCDFRDEMIAVSGVDGGGEVRGFHYLTHARQRPPLRLWPQFLRTLLLGGLLWKLRRARVLRPV
ncbi:MAG: hypothetical protein AAF581_07710 [Planctomycetota bacterium]